MQTLACFVWVHTRGTFGVCSGVEGVIGPYQGLHKSRRAAVYDFARGSTKELLQDQRSRTGQTSPTKAFFYSITREVPKLGCSSWGPERYL